MLPSGKNRSMSKSSCREPHSALMISIWRSLNTHHYVIEILFAYAI